MLKQLSVILALSVAVTACGGSDGKKKTPTSSSVSSAVSSVVVSSSSSSSSSSSVASVTPSSSSASSMSLSSVPESSSAPSSSSSSAAATADLSYGFAEGIAGWFINGEANETTLVSANLSLEHDLVNKALKISPLNWAADNWRRFAKFNMGEVHNTTGATFTVVVNVPQSYITDTGLKMQWIVADTGGENTVYGTYIDSATLTAGDNTLTITNRDVVAARYFGLQLTSAPTDTGIKDPILLKSVEITFAPAGSSSSAASSESSTSSSTSSAASSAAAGAIKVDFESDVAGTSYTGISWNPTDLAASVVTISSITGLPANGASTQVLRITANNYNAGPAFNITVPAGKTLGDYNVKVDAYLPRNTLGLTDNGNNFYKPLLLVAGVELSSALSGPDSPPANPGYISQVGTAGDVDKWHTFTLSTNSSALTGAIKVALGLNRPKGTSADDYYFDNVRLEPK